MKRRPRKVLLTIAALASSTLFTALGACRAGDPATSAALAGPGAVQATVPGEPAGGSAIGDYLAGNYALDTGDIAAATTFFENALAEDPGDLELRRQVFLLDLANGSFDAALREAKELGGLEPPDEDVRLLLALDHARAGRFGQVKEPLAGLGEKGIVGLAAPFVEAWALFGQGEADAVDQALERLRQGESLGPLNRYHEAMLMELGKRPDEAAKAMADALPEGPAPARLVQARAHMLAAHGKQAEALAFVRAQSEGRAEQPLLSATLQQLSANEVPPAPFDDAIGGMADALLGIGEALQQERGGARAVVYARLAQFLKPELPGAALLVGDILTEQGNFQGAISNYEAVGAGTPLGYVAQLRVASALHELDRHEDAYTLLEQIAKDQPSRTDALIELGNLLRREEQFDRAETAYSAALARLGQPSAEDWTLFYARGITYERTKRWPKAEADFLKALELAPEQPFVLNYLGYSWVDQGLHLDRAKQMLKRAVELKPDDGFIVDSMGWVHYRLGDYPKAVEELERAVELQPGDPVINDHLGDAYYRVGRQREAVFQWQRALTLEPEPDVLAAIQKKLKDGLPADPS